MTEKKELFKKNATPQDKDVYNSMLIKQYEVYVESTDRFTSYRNNANTFFLTLNTAFIGVIATIIQYSRQFSSPFWIVIMCLAGIVLNIAWFYLVRSYRTLNSARFKVIHELEQKLPAQIYEYEWYLVKTGELRHIPQSHIEQIVPIAFSILHVLIIGLVLIK